MPFKPTIEFSVGTPSYGQNSVTLTNEMEIDVDDLASELRGSKYAEDIGVGILEGDASGVSRLVDTLTERERLLLAEDLLSSFSEQDLRDLLKGVCPACEEHETLAEEVTEIEKQRSEK